MSVASACLLGPSSSSLVGAAAPVRLPAGLVTSGRAPRAVVRGKAWRPAVPRTRLVADVRSLSRGRDAPPADPWIERSSVGTPCVYTTVERTSSARCCHRREGPHVPPASGTLRGDLGCWTDSWRSWTVTRPPALEHRRDSLRRLADPRPGRGQPPGLGRGRPWVSFIPKVLSEVLQAPDGPAECCAAMLWALSPAPRAGHWWPHSCPCGESAHEALEARPVTRALCPGLAPLPGPAVSSSTPCPETLALSSCCQ